MIRFRTHPAMIALLFVCGCALVNNDGESTGTGLTWAELRSKKDAPTDDNSPVLKVATIEANIVRRPLNDSRIRTLVWEELDESGLMSPEDRRRLNDSGFRVGIAGSSAPWALQSLAKDASGVAVSNDRQAGLSSLTSGARNPVGPAFSVFERGISRLEVQEAIDPSSIPVHSIAELSGLNDLSHLRCTIQVTAEELHPDRAMISVLPQVYSGANAMRLSVVGTSDQLPIRQNVHPLYGQQFRLKLHRGEVAVIGRYVSDDWNAGRLFFQPTSGPSASECLLLIRLVDVNQIKGKSEMDVSVGKKYVW